MPVVSTQRSYWASIWADPELAPQILRGGRIFSVTRRNFETTLARTFGSLEDRVVLDFGCGDGRLLSRLKCRERILFEPSPVYRSALAELAASDTPSHPAWVAPDLGEAPSAGVDLVVMHGVAHYMPLDEIAQALRDFRPLLTGDGLGVVVADLPNLNRLLDLAGALLAHPAAIVEVAGQVFRLSGSRYSWTRLEKHRAADLRETAGLEGFSSRQLNGRSFNRARSTFLLEALDP